MRSTTYLKDIPESHCQPRKETIRFLLDYSKALEIKTVASEHQIEIIKN